MHAHMTMDDLTVTAQRWNTIRLLALHLIRKFTGHPHSTEPYVCTLWLEIILLITLWPKIMNIIRQEKLWLKTLKYTMLRGGLYRTYRVAKDLLCFNTSR